jgi:hypothetical protein
MIDVKYGMRSSVEGSASFQDLIKIRKGRAI